MVGNGMVGNGDLDIVVCEPVCTGVDRCIGRGLMRCGLGRDVDGNSRDSMWMEIGGVDGKGKGAIYGA